MDKLRFSYIENFSRRASYAFGLLSLLGGLAQLAGGLSGGGTGSDRGLAQTCAGLGLLLAGIATVGLARFNRLTLAAWLLITAGLAWTSASLVINGPDSYLPVVYLLITVIAAAVLGSGAALFSGLSSTFLYIIISGWQISRLAGPLSLEKAANLVIMVLALLAVTALLFGFSRNLRRLLLSSEEQAGELARLDNYVQTRRRFEIKVAGQISELCLALGRIFREQNSVSGDQARLVNNAASTIRQLDAAARKIADSALSVATVAEKAERSVVSGQEVAMQGVNAIGRLRERVQDINDSMRTLNQQIERIGEVSSIIGEIADETNLLALNATIEAAGAGEYGRRFAAVADEVQRLARRSTNAVEQIQEMVQEINLASGKALVATGQGLEEAQVGNKLAGSLRRANEDVLRFVVKTSELATSIATATQQQREASAQIVDLMQHMIELAHHLSEPGQDINRVIEALSEAAGRLNRANVNRPGGSTGEAGNSPATGGINRKNPLSRNGASLQPVGGSELDSNN